jgi:hypothetical protein
MHTETLWLRRGAWTVLLGFALSLGPVPAGAMHEVEEAKKMIEDSLKKTFDAFNKGDYAEFADGFTDLGFLNKSMFRFDVDRPFPKDEGPIFVRAMNDRGKLQVKNISEIRMLDHMMVMGTAEVELQQGNVIELYAFRMVLRPGLDRRYKISKDQVLPLRPKGFPVVEVKMTDFGFEFDKKKLAKDMVLTLVNAGKHAHEFVFYEKMMPADWERSIARAAWALKPGQAGELVLAGLGPGNYVMLCCITTQGEPEPHCARGMRAEFSLK